MVETPDFFLYTFLSFPGHLVNKFAHSQPQTSFNSFAASYPCPLSSPTCSQTPGAGDHLRLAPSSSIASVGNPWIGLLAIASKVRLMSPSPLFSKLFLPSGLRFFFGFEDLCSLLARVISLLSWFILLIVNLFSWLFQ